MSKPKTRNNKNKDNGLKTIELSFKPKTFETIKELAILSGLTSETFLKILIKKDLQSMGGDLLTNFVQYFLLESDRFKTIEKNLNEVKI